MSRADWLAARALLASRRLRPFVPFGLVAFALIFVVVYAVRGPLADRAAATQRAAGRAVATERDTLPLVSAVQAARATLMAKDSALRAMQFQAEAQAAAPALSADMQRGRDSLRATLAQLESALDRASKAPLAASYRALGNTRALKPVGGVQSLLDTLDLLERTRQALDPVEAPQREFAQLSQRANAVGKSLQTLGQSRRAALVRQIAGIESGVGDGSHRETLAVDTAVARAVRDSATLAASNAEQRLRDARQWHAAVRERADSAARDRAARILGASPFAAALSALMVVVVLSFTMVVIAEVRTPTIAHVREVERLTGVPVLTTAERFHVPHEGRARLQPGVGVDPFRMVYLALTASGTRERTVCVTGDSAPTTAAVAARLAVSAAADERATLLVDLAPGIPATSAYFGWREEPGFTEAIAGVRLWREVARPIGASEGLAVDVIPSGGPRQDTSDSVQNASARAEFTTFTAEYDFAVLVAPTPLSVRLAALTCDGPPTILVLRSAKTRLTSMKQLVTSLREDGVNVYGILLVDQ